jgi:hypothetical protein
MMTTVSDVKSLQRVQVTETRTAARIVPESEPTSLLPEPSGAAQFTDPAVMVAYLMDRSAETERNEEDQIARANEQVQYRAESDQIHAMRDEASHTFASGVVSGLTEAAAGACQFASALAAPAKVSGADAAQVAAANAAVVRTQGMLKAGAIAFSALKDVGTGFYGAAEKQDEVRAKQADQAAQLAQTQANTARAAANGYSDTVNRALGYMQSFLDMQNQTRLAQIQG